MAWHGTEAAKKAGKEGGDAVRNSAAFRAAQYKAMEAQARMKDTEAFKHLEASGAFKTAGEVKDKVLRELKQVRDGKRSRYENVTAAHLADASDDALRNLATSWGPFQLMGYKCILLDVNIRDIRGNNGIEHGADWINQTYGQAMRQGRYRDCFHMHNTGQPYPKTGLPRTHDPQYVPRGMAMMKQFSPPTTQLLP